MNLNKTRRKVEIEFQKNRIEIRIFPNTSAFIVNQHLKHLGNLIIRSEAFVHLLRQPNIFLRCRLSV